MIENAKRVVAETEDIGLETIAELQSNREKLESARAKVMYRCDVIADSFFSIFVLLPEFFSFRHLICYVDCMDCCIRLV